MSHAYDTRTFTVASEELPSSFSSLEDYETFMRVADGKAREKSDGLHHLWGSTRSGWAISLIENLLKSSPGTSSLQFLGHKGQTYNFETEYGLTAVSVLPSATVDSAADQLDGLLASLKADPGRVYDADEGGVFSDGDLEAALVRDYVSPQPAYDDQVRGDEGEGADYLLTYLRSVLALLRTAQAQGLSVVHATIV